MQTTHTEPTGDNSVYRRSWGNCTAESLAISEAGSEATEQSTSAPRRESTDSMPRQTSRSQISSDSTDVTGREMTSHAEELTDHTADPEERPGATSKWNFS